MSDSRRVRELPCRRCSSPVLTTGAGPVLCESCGERTAAALAPVLALIRGKAPAC